MKTTFHKSFALLLALLVLFASAQPTLAAKTAKGIKATKKVQKVIKKSAPVKSKKTQKAKAKVNKQKQISKPQAAVVPKNNAVPANNVQTAPSAKTVVVNNSPAGFLPVNMPIVVGDTVQFKNDSELPMWPAAGTHPTHELYPEFDAKQSIAPGQSWSFTFKRAGSWRYHDHLNPNHTGTILVCASEKDCAEKFNNGNF